MRIIIMILCIISIGFSSSLDKEWNNLSIEQKNIAYKIYDIGSKNDIGLTLTSIAWQESKFGKYRISVNYEDVGFYHINLYWFFKEMGIQDTMYNRSKYITILITKPNIEEKFVINKILTLKSIYGSWYKVWWHYNGSKIYANNILKKVRYLRKKFKNRKLLIKLKE